MDGRGARVGVTLLVVAAVVMTLPVLLRPREFDGVAAAAPMPEPPPVGSCLAADRRTVVSCDEPHHSEVTVRWAADDPQRSAENSPETCDLAAGEYLSVDAVDVPGWEITVDWRAERVEAPPAERVGTRGWSICTVSVGSGASYSGSLRSITPTRRPAATAICTIGSPGPTVPCELPHTAEQLAWTWQELPDPEGTAAPLAADGYYDFEVELSWPDGIAAAMESQCAQVATSLLATSDPTLGGLVQTAFHPQLFSRSTQDPADAVVSGICDVASSDGRRLIGSLIGIGDAAPTFE